MDEAAAAAGVNSCASDMEKWLRFHMTGGLNDRGERVLSEKNFAEIHKGQMPFLRVDQGASEIALKEYAFGWREGTYRGHRMHMHTGHIADLLPLAFYPCEKEFSPEELTGTYVSEAYGPLRIFARDGKLFCGYHQREDELHQLKGTTYFSDTFLEDTWTIKMPFEFLPAENGIGVKSMVLPMEKTVRPVEFIKQV